MISGHIGDPQKCLVFRICRAMNGSCINLFSYERNTIGKESEPDGGGASCGVGTSRQVVGSEISSFAPLSFT
ncbi:hypothetical protein MLD38_025422 [Melastoma candidum]|uniref:Uncharacterized protein n=1 Tax=Melastoma candidum TaxID=119954 RepID=A0ACB9NV11_9MYRT|nr:hypothetical protein MLD38_025422 [Melastoma candidum]